MSEGQRPRKAPGEEVRHHRSSRERSEQGDRKERKRREEEEEVRRHHDRDRNSSKKLTERSHTHEAKTEVCEHINCLYTETYRSMYS